MIKEIIECACGCGEMIYKFDSKDRERRYVNGHINKNKIHNDNWKRKISNSMMGKIVHPLKTISCKICGILVDSHSPNRIYCNKCSLLKKEERQKEYTIRYKVTRNNYYKKRMNEDIGFRIANRLRNYLRKALNKYTETGKFLSSVEYGIDYMAIIEHLKPFPEDLSKYHIDHIKPLCSFNLTKPEEVRRAFTSENHRWLTKEENLKKIAQDIQMTYSNRLKSVVSSRLSDSILNPDNRKVYKGIIPYNTALTGRR